MGGGPRIELMCIFPGKEKGEENGTHFFVFLLFVCFLKPQSSFLSTTHHISDAMFGALEVCAVCGRRSAI